MTEKRYEHPQDEVDAYNELRDKFNAYVDGQVEKYQKLIPDVTYENLIYSRIVPRKWNVDAGEYENMAELMTMVKRMIACIDAFEDPIEYRRALKYIMEFGKCYSDDNMIGEIDHMVDDMSKDEVVEFRYTHPEIEERTWDIYDPYSEGYIDPDVGVDVSDDEYRTLKEWHRSKRST